MTRLENLSKPPRSVPLAVSIKALFGGFLQQFGWVFFSFGLVFFLAFSGDLGESLSKQKKFYGDLQTAEGVVISGKESGAEENETEVVLFVYEFDVAGQKFEGESYFTGWKFDEGDRVKVDYLAEDPGISRLQGGRWSQFSPWVGLIVLIFPAVGLLFVAMSLPNGIRSAKLLKYGHLAQGRFVSKEATNTQINDQTVYSYTFKFTAHSTGREHLVTSKTHETHKLEGEEFEPLLYLASQPEEAVLFDNLPGSPTVNAQGGLQGGNPLSALACLFLPTLGVSICLVAVKGILQALTA